MTTYFNADPMGFYDSKIHGENIPNTAVKITNEKYEQLLQAQTQGRHIKSDSDGQPVDIGPFDAFNGDEWAYDSQLEIAAVLPAVIANINSACKAAIEGGFISNALGQDYTYDSEEEDQLNIMANVITAAKYASVMHKRKDAQGVGEYVSHTQAEMDQVGDDMYAHKMTQLVKAAALKDAANTAAAANDLAALQAITWS